MRSLMPRASSWSWVTNSVVMPSSVWMRRISSRNVVRTLASNADSGSSSNSTSGLMANARASATRCCCPPDIWWAYRLAIVVSWTSSNISPTRRWRSFFSMPRVRSPYSTLPSTVRLGNRL